MAVLVAAGITVEGRRDIMACEPMMAESEEDLSNALCRKISSTNVLERLNREIRRRLRVVGIFPGMDSYLRPITSYLIEYSEDWSIGKCYIKPSLIIWEL